MNRWAPITERFGPLSPSLDDASSTRVYARASEGEGRAAAGVRSRASHAMLLAGGSTTS